MTRLPTPGSDDGTWGSILNDFLAVEHNVDGSLKASGSLASKYTKPGSGIPKTDLSAAVQASLNNADAAVSGTVADGSITDVKVASGAAIAQSKIQNLTSSLSAKADASSVVLSVNGKTPSTGAVTLVASDIGAVSASGGSAEVTNALTASTASTPINLASGNVQTLTLSANTTVSFSGTTAAKACSISLYVKQDSTGSWVLTWPASVKWPGGIAPTLSAGANKVDLVVLETLDNGTTWYGTLAGADFR